MTQEVKKRIDLIRHGIVPEGYRKAGTDIIPSDWDKSPFRQLGVIASGLVDPQKQPYSEMQHIGPDCIEKDTGRIFETKSASELRLISGKFYFDSDSIVYSKIRPNLNKVCAPPFEGICSADCYSIKPTGKIEKAYLFNLMLGYNFYKRAVACSMRTEMPKINQDDLNNIDISYPKSTTEQKKIAEILTTQDKVIVLERQKIEEIIKEKRFFLEKMFPKEGQTVPEIRFKGFTDPWEQHKFSELVETRRGLTYKPTDIREKGVRVLRSSNIDEGHFVLKPDDVFVDENAVNIDFAKENDILITAANGSSRLVGKHAIISEISGNSTVYGGFMLLGTSDEPYFANAFMSSSWYKRFIDLYVSGGNGAIGNLNKSDLDVQDILVPQKKEQQVIGHFFENLDRLITLHQRKLEEEKKKKKALMQLLLTGIVRV